MHYMVGNTASLCKFGKEHIIDEYIGWLNDPDVNKYLDVGRFPVSVDDIHKKDEGVIFAIYKNVNQKYIGTCSLHKIDWISRHAEIGYMIGDKNYWGQGIAKDVIRMLKDYGFGRLNMHKITAGVVDGNTVSIKVLEHNGFKLYATDPEDFYINGKYLDMHRFYILNG